MRTEQCFRKRKLEVSENTAAFNETELKRDSSFITNINQLAVCDVKVSLEKRLNK